jgi:hypothetical protein
MRGSAKYVVKYNSGDRDEYSSTGFQYDSKSKIKAGRSTSSSATTTTGRSARSLA